MLSILIPTYNYNVYPLARQLEQQAINEGINFELICFDDGSNSVLNIENEKINNLTNCKFVAIKQNVGPSKNRNALVEVSIYEYVLFIDGDSLLPDDKFIKRYIDGLKIDIDVIYGGTVYLKNIKQKQKLRWKYGVKREALTAQEREKELFKCLLFNNTIVRKYFFQTLGFEKSITQYGHEDTIFAFDLQKHNASLKHINNPVIHYGIDSNISFINKTKYSLENLNSIYKTHLIDSNFITFLRIFIKLKRFKLNYLLAFIHKIFYPFFKYNLISKNPSLLIFDLFRLSYFCHINLKK